MAHARHQLELRTESGPYAVRWWLTPGRSITLGRRRTCDVVLDVPQVSKEHAALRCEARADGQWRVLLEDRGSRFGTFVNGVRLQSLEPVPLDVNDQIRIDPWSLRLVDSAAGGSTLRSQPTTGDDRRSQLSIIDDRTAGKLAQERLRLLLQYAELAQHSSDEMHLAKVIVEAAVAGMGCETVAVVRSAGNGEAIEFLAAQGVDAEAQDLQLSRSMVARAYEGQPLQLSQNVDMLAGMSIADLGIVEAICVPLKVESAVQAVLYIDSRSRRGRSISEQDAVAFAVALGQIASLALANLRRRDIELRCARMEGELAAAAAIQQMILPRHSGQVNGIRYSGHCRPGRFLSGDFFDVFALDDQRVAITLGDVAGKGVTGSVVMALSQGFLRSALEEHGQPARAATELNAFLLERGEPGRFVTLWIGVIEHAAHRLTYVNAGHGFAWMSDAHKSWTMLEGAKDPPVSVLQQHAFTESVVTIAAGGRLLFVSDGIIEQRGGRDGDAPQEQFGARRLLAALERSGRVPHQAAAILNAVIAYARTDRLDDDATVLLVET